MSSLHPAITRVVSSDSLSFLFLASLAPPALSCRSKLGRPDDPRGRSRSSAAFHPVDERTKNSCGPRRDGGTKYDDIDAPIPAADPELDVYASPNGAASVTAEPAKAGNGSSAPAPSLISRSRCTCLRGASLSFSSRCLSLKSSFGRGEADDVRGVDAGVSGEFDVDEVKVLPSLLELSRSRNSFFSTSSAVSGVC